MADNLHRGRPDLQMTVNGQAVEAPDAGETLLDLLRDRLGVYGPKDGCSPQGQCGCCTVLVDGAPRVACVTPARRVNGRVIVTIEGLDQERRREWGDALCATGGSQCGFCTPGIVLRLEALLAKSPEADDAAVNQALLAHLCRCTGWQTINEAVSVVITGTNSGSDDRARNFAGASQRAMIEGGVDQTVSSDAALGSGGFAADTAPRGSLRAIPDGNGGWAVGETLAAARAMAQKTQGRRTTAGHDWPLEVPQGEWQATLRTTWVEPGYLETDASWCEPGGEPYTTLANGGAFGAKTESPVARAAEQLALEHGQPVLALASREDTVRWGPKRPPVAAGVRADGSGLMRVVATPGIREAIASLAPGLEVDEIAGVPGPPTSASIRAAGWAEAAVLLAGATGLVEPVRAPNGAEAEAQVDLQSDSGPVIRVAVSCGTVLDHVVLRSYCIGAAHMAYSWVTSEALSVDTSGEIHDLTVRSFGILRAVDTPRIEVEIHEDAGPPVNGSDAVFAAVAAAAWLAHGRKQDWPTGLSN